MSAAADRAPHVAGGTRDASVALAADLHEFGHALTGPLLDADACDRLAALYDAPEHFRSRVVMARHGFGRGEYQYFRDPLPPLVQELRERLYAALAPVANAWAARLGREPAYPARLEDYLARCHAAGQRRPTPLLLRYAAGDYNCLHQDVYGAEMFPLQVVVLLSAPGEDFTGGELVLTEQRPRRQSRVEVMPLRKGEGAAFAVRERPAAGARGYHRTQLRHGVSRVRSGRRLTLGLIFHDAT